MNIHNINNSINIINMILLLLLYNILVHFILKQIFILIVFKM